MQLRRLPAAVLLCLAVLTSVTTSACTSQDGDGASTPTEEVAPTPEPGVPLPEPGPPPPPGAVGPPAVGLSSLPPVPVGQPADFGQGLVATVVRIDPVEVKADGPGEISGPGIEVTVELKNDSSEPVDLNGVVVNAYYGDGIPAEDNDGPPAAPASGPLRPGESRRGVYVFRVPADATDSVTVEVNWSGSPNVVLIRR